MKVYRNMKYSVDSEGYSTWSVCVCVCVCVCLLPCFLPPRAVGCPTRDISHFSAIRERFLKWCFL